MNNFLFFTVTLHMPGLTLFLMAAYLAFAWTTLLYRAMANRTPLRSFGYTMLAAVGMWLTVGLLRAL